MNECAWRRNGLRRHPDALDLCTILRCVADCLGYAWERPGFLINKMILLQKLQIGLCRSRLEQVVPVAVPCENALLCTELSTAVLGMQAKPLPSNGLRVGAAGAVIQ